MHLLPLLIALTDPVPDDNDVVAGWTAFAVFILLGVAFVLLAFSLRKQFRKIESARKAGVYGDEAKHEESEPAEKADDHAQ